MAQHRVLPPCLVLQAPAAAGTSTSGDVYLYEPKPLQEGEEKHVISIFVADEPGLINRVAGVFGRRGANIESLAVGLTQVLSTGAAAVHMLPDIESY